MKPMKRELLISYYNETMGPFSFQSNGIREREGKVAGWQANVHAKTPIVGLLKSVTCF